MTETYIWAVIVGMAALNFVVRFVPIAIVSRVELPEPVMRWLSYVPVSVMGALVASEVLRPGGAWTMPGQSAHLPAAVITAFVYRLTRSFLGASVSGMLSFVLIRWALGA